MIEKIERKTRVKFICKNELHYGIVWGRPATEDPATSTNVEVLDAVKPVRFTVDEKHVSTVEDAEFQSYVRAEFLMSQALSDSLKGVKIRKLLRFPVGDHYAYYVIKKTGRWVSLEWRGFDPSRKLHPDLRWEGKMEHADCLRHLEIENYLQAMLTWYLL